jgi:heme exporter protein C
MSRRKPQHLWVPGSRFCASSPARSGASVIALWQSIEEPNRAGRAVAILTLVGAVNLPIIKFSVDWWSTLHQPASVFRLDGPTIHGSMLGPLMIMGFAFLLLYLTLLLLLMRAEIMNRRAERLELLAAEAE